LDGFTVPEHSEVARRISDALSGMKGPGRTGTFGNIASSHNLIHHIGGEEDTNANTTRRSLLLLESRPVGDADAYTRVKNNLLKRYLEEDLGLWRSSTERKIPHFLLNDFARYWRTMTVDFADKQHDRFHDGFALRNIKLRISRKMLYISGLLACFKCHLHFTEDADRIKFFTRENSVQVAALLSSFLETTPLDLTSSTLTKHLGRDPRIEQLFSAYNEFIGILSDTTKREVLEKLKPKQLETDEVYREARDVSHKFKDAVSKIFLSNDNAIGDLTIRYGVF
jgi:hypothetical protein